MSQHCSAEGYQPLALPAVGEMSASVLNGDLAGASEHPSFVPDHTILCATWMSLHLYIYKFIYFWLHWARCREWRLLFVAVCGLLIAVASLVAEHRL